MPNETLTRNETQSLVNDLTKELEKIKSEIKSKGAINVGIDFLQTKKETLQSKLDDVLKKGGLITEDDYNETYKIIRAKEEKELVDLHKKANRRLILIVGVTIALVAGYFLLIKKK